MKISAIVEQFFTYLLTEKRFSSNTFQAYKTDMLQFEQFIKKNKIDINKLTIKDIKLFLHDLKKEQLAARSMARKISTLKSFFSYAHDKHNFADLGSQLIFPKIEKTLPTYLSEQEIESLLQVADRDTSAHGKRNKVMLYLLYVSGLRISELTNLTIHSMHWDNGFLQVEGKGGKQRMIPLPAPMVMLLKEYVEKIHPNVSDKKENRFSFSGYVCKNYQTNHTSSILGNLKTTLEKDGN